MLDFLTFQVHDPVDFKSQSAGKHVPVGSFLDPLPSFLNCRRLSPLWTFMTPITGDAYLMVDFAVLDTSICYHFVTYADPFPSPLFSGKIK